MLTIFPLSMREEDFSETMAKAKNLMHEQKYSEAIKLCKDTLNRLGNEGQGKATDRMTTQVLFCLSEICHISGMWIDGLMYLSTVLVRSAELADPDIRSEAVIRTADILSKMGRWDKALEKYDEGEKLVKQFENPYLMGRVLIGRGVVFWRRGKYDKALDYASKVTQLAEDIGSLELIGSAWSLKASVNFDTRQYENAVEMNDKALEAFRRMNDNIEVARVLNNKGEVYKITGDFQKAMETFNEGLEVLSGSSNNRSLGYLLTNLTECQIRRGDLARAQKTYKQAEKKVMSSEDKYIKAQLAMVKGLIEHTSGHTSTALRELAKAQAIMQKLDIPYDMGVIQLEHARVLKSSNRNQALIEYENAIDSFTKAHTPEMLQKAKSELGSLEF